MESATWRSLLVEWVNEDASLGGVGVGDSGAQRRRLMAKVTTKRPLGVEEGGISEMR